MWSLIHQTVAVNEWRAKVDLSLQLDYLCCSCGNVESVLHRFWSCSQAQNGWRLASTILNVMVVGLRHHWKWRRLNWRQCLLGEPLHDKDFHKFSHQFSLLEGVTIRQIWLARHEFVLNSQRWSSKKLHHCIW